MKITKLKNYVSQQIKEGVSPKQTYHGLHHTLEVLDNCNQYIERLKIPEHDAYLLRTAALLHDIGFIDEFQHHEANGVRYVQRILPDWGYSEEDIERVAGMILATKIPQKPKNLLEEIICDADLDYLGTDNFYPISKTLYHEFYNYNIVNNEEEFDIIQVKFLEAHHFHTDFAKLHREPRKQEYLKELKAKIGS